jgi:hypothetical protein
MSRCMPDAQAWRRTPLSARRNPSGSVRRRRLRNASNRSRPDAAHVVLPVTVEDEEPTPALPGNRQHPVRPDRVGGDQDLMRAVLGRWAVCHTEIVPHRP